ncbi:transcription termination/antitermination protein NusG [Mycoplasma phocoenae]|uniref:Transcription termination/antitermination protein NusG n=1 Tax=Mycoplasma phocoenae TaxID=754517 RepID=A0A858U623_9MOLU|nr:transcription termination/antitermination protein NusG [Mycoplasma phocoenae]QJG66897.1 transcription termination/antitermination protein NusG [Mycoplasma phocoenae]
MSENTIAKWYMISTVSGKEEKVIDALKNKIEAENMSDLFKEIEIFTIPHLTNKELEKKTRGEEYEVKYKNMYKGYIFIKMVMTDDSWYVVRNTQYVTGLIGSSGKGAKPTPVSRVELRKMKEARDKIRAEFAKGNIETAFKENTVVRINSGEFEGQEGPIIQNNDITSKAFVEIEIFGRKTPVEFDYKVLEIIG